MGIGADDTVQRTAVLFQRRSFEDDGVLDSDAWADSHVGADGDVGADLGGGVDGGRGVDEGGCDDVGSGGGEEGWVGEFVVGEVEGSGSHRRGSGLDLSPEIVCLVDIHFPSGSQRHDHILLETKNLVGLDEGVFRRASRLFVHRNLDHVKQGLVKEVDAAVDNVGDPAFGLFDVVDHLVGLWVSDDAAVLCSGLLLDVDTHDGAGPAVGGVQLEHLGKGKGAADVNVADKDVLRDGRAEDRVPEVVESSGCAEGLVLAQVADGDVGELALGLLDEGGHLGVVVEADDDDFGEVWHFGEGLERVPYHGLPSDGQQRFGAVEGEGPHAGALGGAAYEDDAFGAGHGGEIGRAHV